MNILRVISILFNINFQHLKFSVYTFFSFVYDACFSAFTDFTFHVIIFKCSFHFLTSFKISKRGSASHTAPSLKSSVFKFPTKNFFLKKKMQDGGYKIKNQNLRLPLNQKHPEKRISV